MAPGSPRSTAAPWFGALCARLALPRRSPATRVRFSVRVSRPRVLAVAPGAGRARLGADTQTRFQSDIRKLVPKNLQALRDVDTLEKVTGVSGEIDVTVRGATPPPRPIRG